MSGTGAPPSHPSPWWAAPPAAAPFPWTHPEKATPSTACQPHLDMQFREDGVGCIWGTGVLVVTDISRICLKTCKRWEAVARDLLPTQGQTPDLCYSVFSVNRMYQLPLGAS